MLSLRRRDGLIYGALLSLRLALALRGTAYIHPDEHFQGPEAALADQLQATRTWELSPESPARSMASVKLFNLPVVLVSCLLGSGASGRLLFAVERLTAFALSLVVDGCLAALLSSASGRRRSAAILLYASSGATLTFAVRPFSNNVEAAVLCLCLVVVQQLHRDVERWRPTPATPDSRRRCLETWSAFSSLLGFLVALGLFSRFTFVVFAAPLGIYYLMLVWRMAKWATATNGEQEASATLVNLPIIKSLLLLSDSLNGILFCSLAHVLYDTVYYRLQALPSSSTSLNQTFEQGGLMPLVSRLANLSSWPLTIAPLNALRYNLKADNLALHGLHPRWLHAVVNAPMVAGSAAVWVACILAAARLDVLGAARRSSPPGGEGPARFPLQLLCLCSIAVPLAVLSAQPHQEPRFLLPLVAPAILLVVLGSPEDDGSQEQTKAPDDVAAAPSPSSTATARQATGRRKTDTRSSKQRRPWLRRLFTTLHLLQSAGIVLFFGIAHQGGVVPALIRIGEEVRLLQDGPLTAAGQSWLRTSSKGEEGEAHVHVHAHLHFWRTFMPPRHLLALPLVAAAGDTSADFVPAVSVHEHSSSRPRDLLDEMLRWHEGPQTQGTAGADGQRRKRPQHLLVAPSWAMTPLLYLPALSQSAVIASPGAGNSSSLPSAEPAAQADCQLEPDVLRKRYYHPRVDRLVSFVPHLDADHMGEMWEVGVRRYEEARRRSKGDGDGGSAPGVAEAVRAVFEAAREALALQVVRIRFDEVPGPPHEDGVAS